MSYTRFRVKLHSKHPWYSDSYSFTFKDVCDMKTSELACLNQLAAKGRTIGL